MLVMPEALIARSTAPSQAAEFPSEPTCEHFKNGHCRSCYCGICGGTGYIITSKVPLTVKKCDCQRGAVNEMRLKKLGLLEQCGNCTFESFKTAESWQKSVKELAESYVETGGGWFYIGGQSGAGKTHICVAIIQRLAERSGRLEYFRWVADGKRLKALATDAERTNELDRYKAADILYIDDFLKTAPTEADKSLAFELLGAAYEGKQRVIISSERPLPALNEWDEAIAGRIREKCHGFWITLTGKEKNQRAK